MAASVTPGPCAGLSRFQPPSGLQRPRRVVVEQHVEGRARAAPAPSGPRPARRSRCGGRGCAVIRSALPRKVVGLLARLEDEEAAVLEEAAEDAAHADRLGEPRDARPELADGAGDDVDLGAGLRGRVELLDDRLVGERVRLQADARGLAVRRPPWRPRGSPRRAARRRLNGATSSLRNACGRPKPVT